MRLTRFDTINSSLVSHKFRRFAHKVARCLLAYTLTCDAFSLVVVKACTTPNADVPCRVVLHEGPIDRGHSGHATISTTNIVSGGCHLPSTEWPRNVQAWLDIVASALSSGDGDGDPSALTLRWALSVRLTTELCKVSISPYFASSQLRTPTRALLIKLYF